MPKYISDILKLGTAIDDNGIFDSFLDVDSNYYINIKRLKDTTVAEFCGSYEEINEYFRRIGKLLSLSKEQNDKAYRSAFKMFDFPEVNEIKLGLSRGKKGRGFGLELRRVIIKDLKEIIDLGSDDPEVFHLMGLFEENVGPDRVSDMIARIIYKNIYQYTLRMCKELIITPDRYPELSFNSDGIFYNPYDINTLVLFVPQDILHEIPIAKDWDDIDRVCRENEIIRQEINEIVGESLSGVPTHVKKEFIKKHIFKQPDELQKLLKEYKLTNVPAYDFSVDEIGDYLVSKLARELPINSPLILSNKPTTSMEVATIICNKFKDLVENNKAYELLYSAKGRPRGEKIVQRAFLLVAICYCEANNLDVSPESNAGRGPVDFKMSNGLDKTIVEIKLTSNSKVVHGFETQIEEYAKAEKTTNRIFLLIDNGGARVRKEAVQDIYNERIKKKESVPELIIVDALEKESASHYNPSKELVNKKK